jgi:hypothetical protein
MNFGLEIDENGTGKLTWEKKKSNLDNAYYSVKVPKGSMVSDPDFGLDLKGTEKAVEGILNIIKQRYEQALSWMIDARKASKITVETSFLNKGSVKVLINIIDIEGVPMQFTDFVPVGGASNDFTF